MEKLLNLLNEYKKIKGYDGNTKITNYDTDTGSFTNGYSGLEYEIVIGKRYGFIQWLVDNDKIDLLQLDNRIALSEFNKVERVLMALSISSSPIDDLISYLR